MKIIKQGNLPTATMKCSLCGCEFVYDKRDLELTPYYFPFKDSFYVDCPHCNKHLPVSEDIFDKLILE